MWNFLLRGSADKLLSMTAVVLGHIPIALLGLFIFGLPSLDGFYFILASAIIHCIYQAFLLNAYKYGELSEIYPIARGLSPLLITCISFLFLNENISLQETLGILLISISLIIYGTKQYFGKETDFKGFYLAVITGCLIASYSLVDGYGARVTQNPIGFYSIMTLINGLLFCAYARWIEKDIIKKVVNNGKNLFFIGGTASYMAYAIVVWACLYQPIAVVSSLRETSIIFAILLGFFFLKEKLNFTKCLLILGLFLGVIILRLG